MTQKSETIAVHMSDGYDVDITRRGKWGNIFFIGPDGTRKEVIEKYEVWIKEPEQQHLMDSLDELEGKRLGCLCKRSDREVACHGDVLVRLVNERKYQIF